MSLFGDENEAASRPKSSLFDDDSAAQSKTSLSMFGDAADEGPSPWGFTPSKKTAGRGNPVKSLLADADVPDPYIDAFDGLQRDGQVSEGDVGRLLTGSGVGHGDQDKIWSIVSSNGQSSTLGVAEFNVLLALIGLAQEGEELSLDAVDERKKKLPLPRLPEQQSQQPPATPQLPSTQADPGAQTPPTQSDGAMSKQSFGADFGEQDPWASPQMHRGHAHVNGGGGQRTTSTFTTNRVLAEEPADSSVGGTFGNGQPAQTSESTSWGGTPAYRGGVASEGYGAGGAAGGEGGFGGEGGAGGAGAPRRPVAPRMSTSRGADEQVTVSILEEKEGMFMFQHRNYEVTCIRRNSRVIRRYSDFVWLLDCLHKRYPFRQLPLLPPKRVAINGNHLAADQTFIEKRRRGLARFANALVRHPVLREEQLVVMFLSVPTELAVWRKQATISVQEEFVGKALPPNLEDSLPQDLQETFDTVRSGVRRSAELYINLCNITERLCKRKDAIAGEYGRFSMTLNTLTEASADAYAIDTNDVPLLNEGLQGTAKHLNISQTLIEDESRAWDQGLLEDLKTMRDGLVSMRDMFDRQDRYSKDSIPQLEKRIQQNEQKLQGIKAKGDLAKPGEAEKVETSIIHDKQSIVHQHARGVFIKECVRDEIVFFNGTQFRVSKLHQDWAQERVKYAELQADNFRGASAWGRHGVSDNLDGTSQTCEVHMSKLLARFRSCFRPDGACLDDDDDDDDDDDEDDDNDNMPKRKMHAAETVVQQKRVRATKAYNGSQKAAINEFLAVTQCPDKTTATKYFNNPHATANSPTRIKLSQTFDKYRDDPKNEPDEINADGTAQLLGDMDISLEDIAALVFSELVASPSLGKLIRQGFIDGCQRVNVDDLARLRNVILARKSALQTDRDVFKSVYNHTFQLPLAPGAKTLPLDMALEFWMLLFGAQGYEWKSAHGTPWLEWWLEFLQGKNTKAVNRDLWKQTLTFAHETMRDDSLGFWDEESSWPSVIDEFVEWVKTEKRATAQGEDAMEVE
ncbi:hypothetical protein EJ03DRAFT_336507 [Teratosphaeria nubilosa]|uniref:Sorting nexin MVP1 n=1 Tax=Teratosphaeria nubilosa TaxID=161662 RepID=A0A6G1L8Q4_9PEZI|nr:hypothetical protein EJ03DRAFT_336507 [Teratosphaeria nubilosa]